MELWVPATGQTVSRMIAPIGPYPVHILFRGSDERQRLAYLKSSGSQSDSCLIAPWNQVIWLQSVLFNAVLSAFCTILTITQQRASLYFLALLAR
ncbi:hypothetical protein D3C87_1310870 [compost metagenome]